MSSARDSLESSHSHNIGVSGGEKLKMTDQMETNNMISKETYTQRDGYMDIKTYT
jgi:hypothetical protein